MLTPFRVSRIVSGMNSNFFFGQLITLRSADGEIQRVVVEDLGDVVTVCTPEELDAAKAQYRQPLRVGFKKKDVLRFA